MANILGIDVNELERYETFEKGAVPCIFKIQVKEGFCRFNLTSKDSLELMLRYCEGKSYRVEWTSAVLKESKEADTYKGFPGGMYVAHCVDPSQMIDPNEITGQTN